MRLEYNKTCLGSKLLGELLGAGIALETGIAPVQTRDGITYIFVPDDTQKAQIDAIVANHDPTPPPQPPSPEERIVALEEALLTLLMEG